MVDPVSGAILGGVGYDIAKKVLLKTPLLFKKILTRKYGEIDFYLFAAIDFYEIISIEEWRDQIHKTISKYGGAREREGLIVPDQIKISDINQTIFLPDVILDDGDAFNETPLFNSPMVKRGHIYAIPYKDEKNYIPKAALFLGSIIESFSTVINKKKSFVGMKIIFESNKNQLKFINNFNKKISLSKSDYVLYNEKLGVQIICSNLVYTQEVFRIIDEEIYSSRFSGFISDYTK